MPSTLLKLTMAAAGLSVASGAFAQGAPSRGELLYRTHCIACHTTQMHWRDARRVTDWATLVQQVTNWQARGNLDWKAEDIDEVARWLNASIYNLPQPERRAEAEGSIRRLP